MDPEDIIRNHPRLYHMAEAGSWDSVRQHGLLSTRSLLDLFEVGEPLRSQILRHKRPASVRLEHPVHGTAVVRDQIPLSKAKLAACLTDMSFEEWLDMLNTRVFFWLDEPHLETLLSAGAYQAHAHDVIHVDTAALIERHYELITLSPINSGSTVYRAVPRGSQTFLPIVDYPYDQQRRRRGRADAIIELAVADGIPDIEDVAVRVERRRAGGRIEEILWER
jgi:hypothetical protein